MTAPTEPTVVLIHGLWMTPRSWEHWIDRFKARGHRVIAPAWPGMDGDVEALREDPSAFAKLGVTEVVDHYDAIVRDLDEPPIIMGHSFGGLITEVLLDRGLGLVGVAIDPAPIKGILGLPFSTLRVGSAALRNPANAHRAVMLTAEQFHYAFTNTLSQEESDAVYERYAVPGPGRFLFQGAFANLNPHAATKVDVRKDDRAPLLLISGGLDHVVPASTTRTNHDLYRRSSAHTDYREFPERSHYTLGEPGWEEVADFALQWAMEHAPLARTAGAAAPA